MDPLVNDLERTAPLHHLEKMGAVSRLAKGMSCDVGELVATAAASIRDALALVGPDQPAHESLGAAASALQRAALIARQLEALARPAPARPEARSLGRTASGLLPLVERLAGPAITVTLEGGHDGAWIAAEPGQIEQVLFHLVVNARDAMPDGGSIAIRIGRQDVTTTRNHRFGIIAPGAWTTLEVRDAGCGMSDQVLTRLFEPFFTTKPAGHGSGLGLATVYGIARQLDGQVTVESHPGQGTAVTLWLPMVPTPVCTAAPDTSMAVLLVEDDEWVRAVTARALRRAGYGVLEATDAEAALELLRDVAGQNVRVVLTDIVMPGMWGDALARRIATERRDVRTVLMTGRSPESLPDPRLEGTILLRKPFSRHQLLAAVAG